MPILGMLQRKLTYPPDFDFENPEEAEEEFVEFRKDLSVRSPLNWMHVLCLSVSVYLSSIYASIYLCLSIYPSIYLSIYPYLYVNLDLSIYVSESMCMPTLTLRTLGRPRRSLSKSARTCRCASHDTGYMCCIYLYLFIYLSICVYQSTHLSIFISISISI